jgi:hypothetical protein
MVSGPISWGQGGSAHGPRIPRIDGGEAIAALSKKTDPSLQADAVCQQALSGQALARLRSANADVPTEISQRRCSSGEPPAEPCQRSHASGDQPVNLARPNDLPRGGGRSRQTKP